MANTYYHCSRCGRQVEENEACDEHFTCECRLEPQPDVKTTTAVISLEKLGIAAYEPDEQEIEDALINDYYDTLRYEQGRAVADQWEKEKREAFHQWMRHHDEQVIRNQQKKEGED
ncbi:MAG: hypothetical protein ABF515_02480 [Bifidobacterium sp.]|uniref:Uncharacterized protein n=2 Tax=Bifidobacterium TaxID=1678 RepID=A0A261GBJ5_9BIFI|nr:hypothetical protein [Bifidobacterium aquikefiri]OZG68799.1 hypothetical protein BAQU_0100 [Bifidobacterium aquikefiri]